MLKGRLYLKYLLTYKGTFHKKCLIISDLATDFKYTLCYNIQGPCVAGRHLVYGVEIMSDSSLEARINDLGNIM